MKPLITFYFMAALFQREPQPGSLTYDENATDLNEIASTLTIEDGGTYTGPIQWRGFSQLYGGPRDLGFVMPPGGWASTTRAKGGFAGGWDMSFSSTIPGVLPRSADEVAHIGQLTLHTTADPDGYSLFGNWLYWDVTIVPEPSSDLLFAFGLLMLVAWRVFKG